MRSALAGDVVFGQSGQSRETTSSLAKRKTAFAAINAGFFSPSGDPVGLVISQGEIISESYPSRSIAAWPKAGVVFDRPVFKGFLKSPSGRVFQLDGINRPAGPKELIVFSPKGNRALGPQGSAVLIFSTEKGLHPNKSFEVKYWQLLSEVSDFKVPPNHLVVMVPPARIAELVPELRAGEKWRMRVQLAGSINWSRIQEGVSGGPRLVAGGAIAVNAIVENFKPDFFANRHPRTAIGMTNKGECVWVVVDGRQPFSAGANLEELARLMISLGCRDAINLDGGGSSTFFLGGRVLNSPSDGLERKVSDAVLLFRLDQQKPGVVPEIRVGTLPFRVGSAITLSARGPDGSELPRDEVIWSWEGRAAWVDQGGTVRGLAPGSITAVAIFRGFESKRKIEILQ